MVTGVHAIIYSNDAEADRAFLADVLGWESVDAGGGWLIFASPPAEVAVHPAAASGRHELYLMADDVHATLDDLRGRGVEIVADVSELGFGLLARIRLPGGGELGLYEPRHASPLPGVG
jgi:predicted enzyme related to lactoylglutathione lyase